MESESHWLWLFNTEKGKLCVKLNEADVFETPYKPSQLVNIHFSEQLMDIEDATTFQKVSEVLESCPADKIPCEPAEAALNAAAWERFGKPQMPQSWHFQKSDITEWPAERSLCELNSGFDQGLFLILEADDEFATCLLLNKGMQLSAIKSLRQYHVIKVTLNRLLPATVDLAMSAQSNWGQQLA
ncbi:cell division protein ZapC domain-containing protein [Idiomarina sp. HP20-50]|uniref:cell division protein ZapC domain-containing protein n=1 Tax=Idiomarina sp. HP20-50 TaxID=3070813 RepID=UPI00294B78C4|nr:cell division protein ZapC domain-containing protein [Idiomarina sp. HP20-50]MDV6315122.1 cell division protein ZapC [Idiomarina sp. HP20-50]